MQDRVPTPGQEGRVLITPENGSPYYAKIAMADNPTPAGTPLNKDTLLKDATAALYGLGTDAVPDDVLALLSNSALYKTITPTAQLGTLPEGSVIYLNENGSPVPFYVAKQGYEPGYNTDRVLVIRKEAVQQGAWNSTNANTYDGSTIDTWFNQTYLQTLDSDVQSAIGTTNIPYTPMGGTTSVNLDQIQYTNSTENEFMDDDPSAKMVYRPSFTLPMTFVAHTAPTPTTGLYDISDNLLLPLPGVQIATGSYVGTEASHTISLTFDFPIKFFFISALNYVSVSSSTRNFSSGYYLTESKGMIVLEDERSVGYLPVTLRDVQRTISWKGSASYSSLASTFNALTTYYYKAIG